MVARDLVDVPFHPRCSRVSASATIDKSIMILIIIAVLEAVFLNLGTKSIIKLYLIRH
jgi:hypothetical protein